MSNVTRFRIKDIHCTHYSSGNSAGVAVICHGFASSQLSSNVALFRQTLLDTGLSVVTFDFYGHGESGGDFAELTTSKCIDNTNDVLDYLKRSFSPKKIVLLGYSYGGLIATVVAATRNDISALLLINPLSDYPEKEYLLGHEDRLAEWARMGTRSYLIHERQLQLRYAFYTDSQQYSSYASLPVVTAPTLLVHSEKDEMVPIYQSSKLSELSGVPLTVLPNADHRLKSANSAQKVVALISAFMNDQRQVWLGRQPH